LYGEKTKEILLCILNLSDLDNVAGIDWRTLLRPFIKANIVAALGKVKET
jgi:hypothetical protein